MPIEAAQGPALLDAVKNKFGFVPNVMKEMSKNPAVLKVYLQATEALTPSVLSDPEKQVVMLAVSRANGCNYCQAVHQTLSKKTGVAPEVTDAILHDTLPAATREQVLVEATRRLVEKRGWLEAGDILALEAKGLTRAELYEIIAILGIKTISNYINHIAATAIDPEFSR